MDETIARIRRRFEEAVRAGARVQAAVLLTAVYFLAIGPAALLSRLFGFDLLSTRRAAKTGWTERPPRGPRDILRTQG